MLCSRVSEQYLMGYCWNKEQRSMGSPEMPKEKKQDKKQPQQVVSKLQLHFWIRRDLSFALSCLVSRPEHSSCVYRTANSPDQPLQLFCLLNNFHKQQKKKNPANILGDPCCLPAVLPASSACAVSPRGGDHCHLHFTATRPRSPKHIEHSWRETHLCPTPP